MMESFEKIVDAAKSALQCSTQIAKVAGPTSRHAPHCDRIYAVCKEEGMVRERKARSLMGNNGQ